MSDKNAATRQDVIANSVDHEIFAVVSSASSQAQLDNLLRAGLDHGLIAWPRQYLETYLDSDVAGRVPLDAEQLQDVLEAALDRDATLARDYLGKLDGEREPTRLGDSTLQVAAVHSERKETEYELLFDPRDSQDLRDLIEKLDIRTWERTRVRETRHLEAQPDIQRRESAAFVVVHQPGSGAVDLHDKTSGTDVRKLLGDGEMHTSLQSALKEMAPGARIEHAQTNSDTYRGRIIAETEKNLIQQITSRSAVVHGKDLLDMVPAVGENVRIAYSNDIARVLPVKERSKTQELGR